MNTTVVNTKFESEEKQYFIHPLKFLLWLMIVASVMLFAAFTSAYIVRRGEGNWFVFDLPQIFNYTTLAIFLSSVTIQSAYYFAKRDELNRLKYFLTVTLVLGILFVAGQWIGWKQLVAKNVHFVGNPSESFIYVITGLHLFHIIAAIIFLCVVLVKSLQLKVHKKNMLWMNLSTTFWHFVGVMWIYLYFFLLNNR